MSKYSPFERKTRSAARWALYSAAALSGVLCFILIQLLDSRLGELEDRSPTQEEWESRPEVALLQHYVSIDTSEREIEGARFLAAELSKAGLEPTIEQLGDGRANLWAVLEGESPQAIVLHNHLDVFRVVEPERWEFPPFEGLIETPFLYGRGAFDMKSTTIAQLQAIRALAASGIRPKRTVIFLATADEESGSRLGTRWLLREHPELLADADLVLTEGGIIEPIRLSEIKYWGIETAQKRFATITACFPTREPLDWLYDMLKMRQREFAVPSIAPEVAVFAATYGPTRQDEFFQDAVADLISGDITLENFRALPAYLRSPFLNEVVAFPVEQTADGGYRLPLIAHLLPGAELQPLLDEVLPAWMTHGLGLTISDPVGAATGSSTSSADFQILQQTLRETHPDASIGPYFLSWSATDARFFRQAGIATYGFSPFLIFNTESYRADTINERINIPGFVSGVEIYVNTVRRLASSIPGQ